MIRLTGFNNIDFYLNSDLIEKIEITPDTVITTTNGKKFVVKDTPEEIINKIIKFRQKIMTPVVEVIE
ncbi:Flagellar protein (FlbD) [Caloramator mitchellensis]|uniref:Flagellar protein (FlbD) n=1 Tax=Caloramator mitchellensis TaxID=908809 RepID=A0A0R3JU43_CALMK|nr:flagellar FlbD family protein [Caloramator mitchellensis]KRQ87051.1 Flagellar protein (FlbD) [Caloramator mitchellensis]